MEEIFNIELRSVVLKYSLGIELLINNLVLSELGILGDEDKTKLFSNKGRMNFQSKLDLLNDIGTLSNDEALKFELIMFIRNKFMHDLYTSNLVDLMKSKSAKGGISNRFKKYLNDKGSISNEKDCEIALKKLSIDLTEIVKLKINNSKIELEEKYRFLSDQMKKISFYSDFIARFINQVCDTLESVDEKSFEDTKFKLLEIEKITAEYSKELNNKNNEFQIFDLNELDRQAKSLFDIKRDS